MMSQEEEEGASLKYGDLRGSIQMVELQKGQTGLGLSLAGNKDRTKMSVFVCGLHPKGSAFTDGRIKGQTPTFLDAQLTLSPAIKWVTRSWR